MRLVTSAFVLAMLFAFALGATNSSRGESRDFRGMLRLRLGDDLVEGKPLAWSAAEVTLLGRDGRLYEFPPTEAQDFSRLPTPFSSYSASEIRGQLYRELGNEFEITGTGHYLVAHPRGTGELWAQRFEDIYRAFVHYFSVRDMHLGTPEFPLVAIVWPTQADFVRYAAKEGTPVTRNILGYYSPTTNRIAVYDIGAGDSDDAQWAENMATVVHEATHQAAFNTGVHNRLSVSPLWIVEGLGTMFEAPGIWDNVRHRGRRDELNVGRLAEFKQWIANGRPAEGALEPFVGSDELFRSDMTAAYAQAWALTYFLVSTRPQDYRRYLSKVAARPDFSDYTAPQRLADFTAVFGRDLNMLDVQFVRFVDRLE
ncbi:MAG: DUF1570 domain-containing protein [Pirellulales bacterium]